MKEEQAIKRWPVLRIERATCERSCSKCDEAWYLIATAEDGHEFTIGTIRAGNDDAENRGMAARIVELWNEDATVLQSGREILVETGRGPDTASAWLSLAERDLEQSRRAHASGSTSCGAVWIVLAERDMESWVAGVYATEEAALAGAAEYEKTGAPSVSRRVERWGVEPGAGPCRHGSGREFPYAVCPGCRQRYAFDEFMALRLGKEHTGRRVCATCGAYIQHYRRDEEG